jgi:hypothetical protein
MSLEQALIEWIIDTL